MSESSNYIINSPEVKTKIAASKIIDNLYQRKDCYGNIISRKTKGHKICFRDNLEHGKEIAEVHIVTSYKGIYDRCNLLLI